MRTSDLNMVASDIFWTYTSSNITALSGWGYFLDVNSSSHTLTLPSNPDKGDLVLVSDVRDNSSTNNITIGRNGQKIRGNSSDYVISKDGDCVQFVYCNSSYGWQVVSRLLAPDQPVYYYGGRDKDNVLNSNESFDGTSWVASTDVPTPKRHVAGYFSLAGSVYWAGGTSNTSYGSLVSDCDGYDGSSWSAGGDMTSSRYGQASFVMDSRGYSCGGRSGSYLSTCDYYEGSSWTNTTGLLDPSRGEVAGETLRMGYIMGGYNSGSFQHCDSFDGTTWVRVNAIPSPARADAAASMLLSTIYLMGGWTSNGTLQDNDKFDGTTWTSSTSLSSPARGYAAAATMGTKIHLGGGHTTTSYYKDLDSFDGSTWTNDQDMTYARAEHGAASL